MMTALEGAALVEAATDILTEAQARKIAGRIRSAARERVPAEQRGWVIEGAWSNPAVPEYWCGSSLWSSNHLRALRFAREHDARQAADAMCAGMNVRICEHLWFDDAEERERPGAPAGRMVEALREIAEQVREHENAARTKADGTPSHPNAEGVYIERLQVANAFKRVLELCDAVLSASPAPGRVGCADCGRTYGDANGFPDLVVPDDVWAKISPTGHGGGLLCPSCMCARAQAAGVSGVPARFTSGPFEPAPVGEEVLAIIAGFLACPEIADCHPEDKEPETSAIERRARALLQLNGDAA